MTRHRLLLVVVVAALGLGAVILVVPRLIGASCPVDDEDVRDVMGWSEIVVSNTSDDVIDEARAGWCAYAPTKRDGSGTKVTIHFTQFDEPYREFDPERPSYSDADCTAVRDADGPLSTWTCTSDGFVAVTRDDSTTICEVRLDSATDSTRAESQAGALAAILFVQADCP